MTEDDDQLQTEDDCSGPDDVYNVKAMESVREPMFPVVKLQQQIDTHLFKSHVPFIDQ